MSLFWNLDDAAVVTPTPLPIITTGTVDCGDGVYLLKAGTPLDEDGAVSNDGDAVALVAEDFYFYSNTPTQPKLVPLITAGYVDLNAAEAAAGITYTDACKTALGSAGIVLVDGALDSGPTIPEVSDADDGKFLRVVDGAWAAATVDAWQGGSY